MKEEIVDVAIIGAGAAGLAAATVIAAAGRKALVIDREDFPGGILRQCIHSGFGLKYYHEELTGPEYAERATMAAKEAGVSFALGCTVTDIQIDMMGAFTLVLLSAADGVRKIHADAVVLAMGCRERNRGNIATPGTRPAGVFTAGTAQKLLNLEGCLPGKTAVIVGSGDIGLIMARRLKWSGMEVKGVVEIMPHPSGLARNIAQCLEDFGIPLWLEHSVTRIIGRDRVEGVEVAPLNHGEPDMSRSFTLECDTLLYSVGLIPETELAQQAGVLIDPDTGGPLVDANYETSVAGIFSAGNVLHVHDLVDFVSEEATRMAHCVLARLDGAPAAEKVENSVGANLKYVVPAFHTPGIATNFSFRPLIIADDATLRAECEGKTIWEKRLKFVRPAEMISVTLPGELIGHAPITFHLQDNATH